MPAIVGRGGRNDPRALALETRQKNWIDNEIAPDLPPVQMREAIRVILEAHPDVILRSAASRYNCMAFPFASRRTTIDTDLWDQICTDDEYRRLRDDELPTLGDVAIYRLEGDVAHVAVVLECIRDLAEGTFTTKLLSQWGNSGEYIHQDADVPVIYGVVAEYWTDRRPAP